MFRLFLILAYYFVYVLIFRARKHSVDYEFSQVYIILRINYLLSFTLNRIEEVFVNARMFKVVQGIDR